MWLRLRADQLILKHNNFIVDKCQQASLKYFLFIIIYICTLVSSVSDHNNINLNASTTDITEIDEGNNDLVWNEKIITEPELFAVSTTESSTNNNNNNNNTFRFKPLDSNKLPNFIGAYSNLTSTINRRITNPEDYAKSVIFKYFKDGQLTHIADGLNEETLEQTGCNPNDKFAFILHGWKENCDVEWVPFLISKLTKYRGGCIICIDYGYFAKEPYVRLVRQYEPLSDLITEKLKHLQNQGFNPDKGYMFGFSYGGQIACAVGRKLGAKLIKEIDTCDMAGPGFDYKVNRLDHRDAAQNVQCIHTTRDKGTKFYTCDQDWRMGNCGFSQPAAQDPPKGSHGLCPYFYINAFEYAFYAVKQPEKCVSKNPALSWPDKFKMGYMESRKSSVHGELFAYTGQQFPFNIAIENKSADQIQYPTFNNFLTYDPHLPIPRFRERPILNSIFRARKFIRRLQRNLRRPLSYY